MPPFALARIDKPEFATQAERIADWLLDRPATDGPSSCFVTFDGVLARSIVQHLCQRNGQARLSITQTLVQTGSAKEPDVIKERFSVSVEPGARM